MYEMEKVVDRVILAGIITGDEEETNHSLNELGELAETAGAEVAARITQARRSPDPGTYLGSGKLEEIRELLYALDGNCVICDDELSPAQLRNLQEELQCKVIDRTLLILDIFAGRARTSEGKLQVELAQLRYRAAHLAGLGKSLSRLGGGIGTRGPGEKKLETDRRLIQERIGTLKKELEEVRRHRDVIRAGRKKSHYKTVAIVGYTNAGKSTLLNMLTEANVLEEDALFATLDPTTRAFDLPGGSQILLTDTVGFIRKLPHHLIEAFKSTLEEAAYADLILHVVDASSPDVSVQMQVVYQTLHDLKADEKPIITLFNKQDLLAQREREEGEKVRAVRDIRADRSIPSSIKHGVGLQEVAEAIEDLLRSGWIELERVYPYSDAGKIALIRASGELLEERYESDGVHVRARVPREVYGQI